MFLSHRNKNIQQYSSILFVHFENICAHFEQQFVPFEQKCFKLFDKSELFIFQFGVKPHPCYVQNMQLPPIISKTQRLYHVSFSKMNFNLTKIVIAALIMKPSLIKEKLLMLQNAIFMLF